MTSITISADETLVAALNIIAQKRSASLETIAREALQNYVRSQPPRKKTYSFIGIGHSKKGNLSKQVDTILEQAANKQEGWSLH